MRYRTAIGLEVHVQLKTRSKMFCGCGTRFAQPPNTQVCPVCLGYPGSLPVMNGEAIRLTVLTGLMIGSSINRFSKFDRKSYFYPDMPKNYQISQYDQPLCLGGQVEVDLGQGSLKPVRVRRIHLEEDVGKNIHFAGCSGVDFNRAGVPLMEIVTEPDLESPEEAYAFLQALRHILLYADVSECNLEEGNFRCDANASVRPEGEDGLGTKAEIKNLNTSKGVQQSLAYEIERQVEVLEGGGRVVQETRRWNGDTGVTTSMRSKEDAHDYRYFPDPDLMPVVLADAVVEEWRSALPEAPRQRHERLVRQYGLPDYDAGVLAADRWVADFFEETAGLSSNPKAVSNWIMTEMLRLLAETGRDIRSVPITPRALADLVKMVDSKGVNYPSAKEIFSVLFQKGGDPAAIMAEKGLSQVSDASAIEGFVQQAMQENARSVEDFRKGKAAALKFLIGQVMRLSKGKANPQVVTEILEEKLKKEP